MEHGIRSGAALADYLDSRQPRQRSADFVGDCGYRDHCRETTGPQEVPRIGHEAGDDPRRGLARDVGDDQIEIARSHVVVAQAAVRLDGFQAVDGGVLTCVFDRQGVPVDHVHRTAGRSSAERQSQRTVPASQVEHLLERSGTGQRVEQHRGAGIDLLAAEQLLRHPQP